MLTDPFCNFLGPPGVLGIWGEWLFIFRDLGSTGNYFRGAGEQAHSFGVLGSPAKKQKKIKEKDPEIFVRGSRPDCQKTALSTFFGFPDPPFLPPSGSEQEYYIYMFLFNNFSGTLEGKAGKRAW